MDAQEGRSDRDVLECTCFEAAHTRHLLKVHGALQEMDSGVSALGQLHGDGQSVGDDMKVVMTSQSFREVPARGTAVDEDAVAVRH